MSDDRPAGTLVWLVGVGCGLLAFLLSSVDVVTLAVAGVGLVALAVASLVESRPLASVGGFVLLIAVVLAATAGLGVGVVVAAAVATLLAWTFTHSALDLRGSLGTAPSRDLELAHVAGTTLIAGGAGLAALAAFQVDLGTVPPLALGLVIVGGIALAAALRS